MKYLYVDSSIMVSLCLEETDRSLKAMELMKAYERRLTTELSIVEVQAGISQQLSSAPQKAADSEHALNAMIARFLMISVSSTTLGLARALVRKYRISPGLRSSDAIHLATANSLRELHRDDPRFQIEYLTADRRQHAAFIAEGYLGQLIS